MLKINIAEDLSSQKFQIPVQNGYVEAVTLENPLLTLDPVRLNQIAAGRVVTSYFGNDLVQFNYGGVTNIWNPRMNGTWPPSIDAFLFMKTLKDEGILSEIQKNTPSLDIACGTGIVGQYLANNEFNNLTFSDINPFAVSSAAVNYLEGLEGKISKQIQLKNGVRIVSDDNANFIVGDIFSSLKGNKYGLISASAPPYAPCPKKMFEELDEREKLMSGTRPSLEIVKQVGEYLENDGKLIMGIDNLSVSEVIRVAEKNDLQYRELAKMDSPFRFRPALDNSEWCEYLVEKGLRKEEREGYDYWHTMFIGEFSKK